MIEERKNKIVFITLFLCLTHVVFGQMQTKTDTILCRNKNMIIEYPAISKINLVNYEEGYFKTINCTLDTATITIHCGSMVNLPLIELTNKTICSEFILSKDIRSVRGYFILNGKKKYFREDNYFKYNITVTYENAEENELMFYEHFFNNIKIQ